MSLTKLSLRRPVSVIIVIAAIVIFGVMSILGLKLQHTPDMEMPMFVVYTTYIGVSPEDIDELVTQKIEDTGSTLKGIKSVTSQSMENVSVVIFQYEYGTDMDDAYMDLLEAINQNERNMPEDCGKSTIIELDMNALPIVSISVSSEDGSSVLNYVNDEVVPEIEKISDVAKVEVSGGEEAYISVCLDQQKMNQYGIDMSTVARYISAAKFTMPVGTAELATASMNVSISSDYDTIEKIMSIPVTTAKGSVIQLSDVATVSQKFKKSSSVSRYNGNAIINVNVSKRQSASEVSTAKAVVKTINRLDEKNDGIKYEIVSDLSEDVISALSSVFKTLILGMVISMVVLFIFFGDIKGSLIVASSMPVSVLMTLILMNFMGFSLNIVTMGGLVIGVGMMVDNSIVVLESCFRMRDENLDFNESALEGTKFVLNSIVASTATTVAVFLPIALTKGLSGQVFKPLGFTIVFSLLASLISAITLIPLFFFKYKPVENKKSITTRFMAKVSEVYSRIIGKVLKHKVISVIVALVLLVGTTMGGTKLHMELMPQTDNGHIQFSIAGRPGTSIDKYDAYLATLEEYVSKDPDVEKYNCRASASNSSGTLDVYLKKDRSRETWEVADEWKAYVSNETGFDVSVTEASDSGMGSGMGSAGDVTITLMGRDRDDLEQASYEVEQLMKETPGIISVNNSSGTFGSKAKITIDPLKAAAVGFTPAVVAGNVNMALSGVDTIDITRDGQEYKVTVEYPEGLYSQVADLSGLTMVSPMGKTIMLGDISEIVYTDSPEVLTRDDGRYSVTITGTSTKEKRFEVEDAVKSAVSEMSFRNGVEQDDSMADEIMKEELSSLGVSILVAVLLVLMLMAMQFESIRFSVMVMWCIPFSFVGSIGLMLLTQTTVSMVTMMGILLLIGTVVNNGILFVDTANQLRANLEREAALIETGKLRLRPILMTSLTTILAMLPMAIGLGNGTEMMQSMAIVIIGGYVASMVLTLLLLPVFYCLMDKRDKKKKDRKKKGKKEKSEVKELEFVNENEL